MMQNELLAIKKSFNKAALTYNQYAQTQLVAGDTLINCLTGYRDEFENAIDLGCGTGLVTRQLAENIVCRNVDAIDIADELLPEFDDVNISYFEMDFNHLHEVDDKYDLIFSNMSLHWSEKFSYTLAALRASLTDNGLLAFTIPLKGTFAEINDNFSINDFFDLETVAILLQSLGYRLIHLNQLTYVNRFQDTFSALRSIKMTGANHVRHREHKNLHGKSFLQSQKISSLSYVIGYFIARK